MNHYQIADGVICGRENDSELFIRKVNFAPGYSEPNFHHHKNSFEYYIVTRGKLTFATSNENQTVETGSIVYFQGSERHRISNVAEKAELLLIKKAESEKVED